MSVYLHRVDVMLGATDDARERGDLGVEWGENILYFAYPWVFFMFFLVIGKDELKVIKSEYKK